MSVDDTELRDLLIQQLESDGTLSQIRAQLRARVFLALEENKSIPPAYKSGVSKEAKALLNSAEGLLAVNLILEFLTSLNCLATVNVFQAEMGLVEQPDRSQLLSRLDLPTGNVGVNSVLVMLLNAWDRKSKDPFNLQDKPDTTAAPPSATGALFGASAATNKSANALGATYSSNNKLTTGLDNKENVISFDSENDLSTPRSPKMKTGSQKLASLGKVSAAKLDQNEKSSGPNTSSSSESQSSKKSPRKNNSNNYSSADTATPAVSAKPQTSIGGGGSSLGDLPALPQVTSKRGTLAPMGSTVGGLGSKNVLSSILSDKKDEEKSSSSSESFSFTGKKDTAAKSAGAASLNISAANVTHSKSTNLSKDVEKSDKNPKNDKKSSEEEESEIVEDISVDNDLLKSEASKSSQLSF